MTEQGGPCPALITLKEAAERLRCSAQFLRYYVIRHPYVDGEPTHRRLGRKIMFTEMDFERVVANMAPKERGTAERQRRAPAVTVSSSQAIYRRLMKKLEAQLQAARKKRRR